MVDSVELGIWVSNQRKQHKNFMNGKKPASIADERVAELNALGFEWKKCLARRRLETIADRNAGAAKACIDFQQAD